MKWLVSIAFVRLASGSATQAQDELSANPRLVATDPDGACSLEWSPDGRLISVAPLDERQYLQWGWTSLDAQGHQVKKQAPEPPLRLVRGSGKDKVAVYSRLKDTTTPLQNTNSALFNSFLTETDPDWLFQVSHFSGDGRKLSLVAGGAFYTWSTSTGKLLKRARLTAPPQIGDAHAFASISPDGRMVVSSLDSDAGAALFDTRTGRKIFSIPNPRNIYYFRVGFIQNRFLFVTETASQSDKPQFSIWSIQQRHQLWSCPTDGLANVVPRRNLAVVSTSKTFEVRDVITGRLNRTLANPTNDTLWTVWLAPSPDGSQLWASYNNGQIWSWRLR